MSYLTFKERIEEVEVIEWETRARNFIAYFEDGSVYSVPNPEIAGYKEYLLEQGIKLIPRKPRLGDMMPTILSQLGTWLVMIVTLVYVFTALTKATTKSKTAIQVSDLTNKDRKITFEDVAGHEEAKKDLMELAVFLKDPEPYIKVGAKMPRGTLLYGPPGTGKTLLAKSVAGTANVKFISISGSDFIEVYAGVGAARVRELFNLARNNKPCIIFIDELDALGRKRGGGLSSSDSERDQALNQLLVEMDGFSTEDNIHVIAATNRIDVLDEALLRAGRFDRHIYVGLPDLAAREKILEIHASKRPLDKDIDLAEVARMTTYMSGAELANVMNEASVYAGRNGDEKVNMQHIKAAISKVLVGDPSGKHSQESDKEIAAYHEAGHAITAAKFGREIVKVSIIPSNKGSGGHTQVVSEEPSMPTKKYLLEQIAILLAGRAAESLMLNQISAGASDDLQRATSIATKMVEHLGMSEDFGLIHVSGLGNNEDVETLPFIRNILDECYEMALNALKKDELERVAKALMDRENITGQEFKGLLCEQAFGYNTNIKEVIV